MDDRTKAQALILAEAYLEKMGWKCGPKDIGLQAAIILNSLKDNLRDTEHGR